MIGDGLIIQLSAITLIIVFLAARWTKRARGGFFKSAISSSDVMDHSARVRFFEPRRTPAVKTCPGCAEQLPLSALLCDACDYNFLAARPGQKRLPSPESMTHEAPEPKFAAAAL
jgi:uncharacterized protein UPF0547